MTATSIWSLRKSSFRMGLTSRTFSAWRNGTEDNCQCAPSSICPSLKFGTKGASDATCSSLRRDVLPNGDQTPSRQL
jgi:hypothetical protein